MSEASEHVVTVGVKHDAASGAAAWIVECSCQAKPLSVHGIGNGSRKAKAKAQEVARAHVASRARDPR